MPALPLVVEKALEVKVNAFRLDAFARTVEGGRMRRFLPLLVAISAAAACTPAGQTPPRSEVGSLCSATDIPACEASLSAAWGAATDTDKLVEAYLQARALSAGSEDAWVQLDQRLRAIAGKSPSSIVIVVPPGQSAAIEAALREELQKAEAGALTWHVLESPALPTLTKVREGELLAGIARRASLEQIVTLAGTRIQRSLGRDNLAPLVFEATPVLGDTVRADDPRTAPRLAARAMLMDHLVNAAVEHLSQGRYREAAALAVRLSPLVEREPLESVAALRARFFVRKTNLFGANLPDKPDKDEPPADESRVWKVDATGQGPYAAWLRVLLAGGDAREAYARHRDVIALGFSEPRREALDALYGFDPAGGQRCEVERQPMPAVAWNGDPLFANRLAWQAKMGVISPAEWARGYEALVRRVERTGTSWDSLSSLLVERGELPGLSTRGSESYRRVTQLAVAHLTALERFQRTAPDRYNPSGQLVVAMQPGALGDPEIAGAVQRLVADNVKYKLAPASASKDLLETTFVLGAMGVMFPEPMRSAYLGSLSTGLDEKLRTGLGGQVGWDVAALYALNSLGGFLLGGAPDLAFAGDNITRALENDPDIKIRPLALIAARGVQYGTLIATKELEPERVGAAQVGAKRREARTRLEASLASMGAPGEQAPAASVRHLATLLDGLIATTTLIASQPPRTTPQDACAQDDAARLLPAVQRNLTELRRSRDALLRDPALRRADSAWSRRAGLLVVVASDVIDALSAPAGAKPVFRLPSDRAATLITNAVQEWTSPEVAAGVAGAHGLARALAVSEGEWVDVLDNHKAEIGDALRGVAKIVADEKDASSLGRYALTEAARLLADGDGQSVSGLGPKLVGFAQALYAAGKSNEATIALLVAAAVGSDDREAMKSAVALGWKNDSPAAWIVAAREALRTAGAGQPLDARAFERAMRHISDDACKGAQVDPLVQVGGAVSRFARGERKEATASLDAVLDRAEREGIAVPRVQYQFDELLSSGRILRLNMHMTTGQGFIAENSFTVGFDVYSTKPSSGLKVEVLAPVPDDAGRYYAQVAMTAGLYHLLQDDAAPASRDIERALNALWQGVRIGEHMVKPQEVSRWIEDLDVTLRVTAQAAIDKEQPLLAGDALRVLRDSSTPVKKGAPLPQSAVEDGPWTSIALRSVPETAGLLSAATRTKGVLVASVACDEKLRPKAPANVETCTALRQGIALWRAGAYANPPAMRAGAKESCARELLLLETIADVQSSSPGAPMPARVQDKVATLIERTARRGALYDALALLRMVKEKGQCVPKLVVAASAIGRRPDITPQARVDWIGYTLTCPGRVPDESVWEDLGQLADASERLADHQTTYQVQVAVVRYMINQRAWDRLASFVRRPGFVRLMNLGGPSGSAVTLMLQHGADVLSGKQPDLAGTKDAYEMACVKFGNAGRERVCRELGTFRNRAGTESLTTLAAYSEQLLGSIVTP